MGTQERRADVDERMAALVSNASAIRSVAAAVEGTLGPKGLNVMLVDKFGDTTVTNDGITILRKIDANHPAARMLIDVARAQEDEVGDGTTTAAILASALVTEGVNQISRGVPAAKVIEGMKLAASKAVDFFQSRSVGAGGTADGALRQAALIAGRGNEDVADLAVEAARVMGEEKLKERNFKLAKAVVAKEGAESEVFRGVIIDKERLNKQMPNTIEGARVLVVDDALEPEEVDDDALGTEAGFARYLDLKAEFKDNIAKLVALGASFVAVGRGVDDSAEEMLTDAGAMVVRRVSSRDLERLAEHTGARPIKRAALSRAKDELERALGACERVYEDEKLEHIRVLGGAGKPAATILVGAATREVKDERERIAKDAAAAAQSSLVGGVLPGGGSIEAAASSALREVKDSAPGMASYGVDCMMEALKRPLAQIVANAGFNPLEKVEDVVAAQARKGEHSLAVDCDTGEITDMLSHGVVDPALVKIHALRAASEVAEAILRINTIIQKRPEEPQGQPGPEVKEIHP
jgi:chaperonin GroEL (HSP60 family)